MGKKLEKSASLRKNRPMKGCHFCIPVDNWGDFSAKNVGSKPVTCNEEAPKGSRTFGADFSGFDEAVVAEAPNQNSLLTNASCPLPFLLIKILEEKLYCRLQKFSALSLGKKVFDLLRLFS
ncbi:MAG: hypothetical protein ACREPR_14395 [Brasilonema sp.]